MRQNEELQGEVDTLKDSLDIVKIQRFYENGEHLDCQVSHVRIHEFFPCENVQSSNPTCKINLWTRKRRMVIWRGNSPS